MALEKSEAVILRVIPFRDTSKVLTAYTAEHGLVSLLAKGVRGAKPRFGAALELFAVVDLIYYQRESRELQLLSQATLLEPHLGLSRDPARYIFGAGVLEFLLKLLVGQEPPGRLYQLSARTLRVLEECPRESLFAVFRGFQLKAVSFLGHRPELYRCVECGRDPEGVGRAGFSPILGGVVCGECAGTASDLMVLSPPCWRLLRRLLTSTLAALAEEPPPGRDLETTSGILERFLATQLERYEGLRSVRMVPAVARAAAGAPVRAGNREGS